MMLDGFITLLTQDATVSGLVSVRIYKNVAPRGYIPPVIVIHRYGGTQEYQYNGPAGVREDQIQVDCYAPYPDAAGVAQQISEAVRSVLVGFVGTLPGGGIQVQGCYLERAMDMPFMPNADAKGITCRSLLGFKVVTSVVP